MRIGVRLLIQTLMHSGPNGEPFSDVDEDELDEEDAPEQQHGQLAIVVADENIA